MEMLWKGKPLSEYTKEELIAIVNHMARIQEGRRQEYLDTLGIFMGSK